MFGNIAIQPDPLGRPNRPGGGDTDLPHPLEITHPSQLKELSEDQLMRLADQVRSFLMETVSETGGHIGANLGTVDLTIALHRVFDSPADKILWDTGHQGYTHKILTGRAHLFPTLNSYGGLNRFVTRTESEHDIIEASHAGTSISVGLGLALAKKLKGDRSHVVTVIGDGSLSEGLALEALNHASVEPGIRLLIVLNDNGFAISPGFGALHNYLKERVAGQPNRPETLFTALGYQYFGPVNGHDIPALLQVLEKAKVCERVALVHVKTIKGYGFSVTQNHPLGMHFSFPFDPESGRPKGPSSSLCYQDVAARVILEEMEQSEEIVAITPSTLYATGLQPVFDRFPDRCFDPGMEEQHAMTMTVGFALEGYRPVIFYQSTFMQRAFDQLIHDVCFMNLPTLILTVRTGFAGYDNPTHHGIYDFSYLRGLPNLRLLYPKDGYELGRMVRDQLRSLQGPTLIAMPYGPAEYADPGILDEPEETFTRPQVVRPGSELLLVAVGHKFSSARGAMERLRERGIDCGLVNLRYLKPLPEESLVELLSAVPRVVSIEEGVLEGGVGSALASLVTDRNLDCELLRIGLPCQFVEPGSNEELCRIYGLDSAGIVEKIERRWYTK